jgi:hypothetical protein
MVNDCEIEGNPRKSKIVRIGKEKFNFVITNFLDGKIDTETAAKKLDITEDVLKEYLKNDTQLKAIKGLIYEVIAQYKENKITPMEGAMRLNVGIATFYNYFRRFGNKIKKYSKFNPGQFREYYINFTLGKISAEEGAKELDIHVETFRWYVKSYKKLVSKQ